MMISEIMCDGSWSVFFFFFFFFLRCPLKSPQEYPIVCSEMWHKNNAIAAIYIGLDDKMILIIITKEIPII